MIRLVLDWVSFRTMVTPLILKVVFQIFFWIFNIGGLLLILLYDVTSILGGILALGQRDGAVVLIGAIVLAVVVTVLGLVGILVINVAMRVSFELALLMFNMYDSMKEIERSLKAQLQHVRGASKVVS